MSVRGKIGCWFEVKLDAGSAEALRPALPAPSAAPYLVVKTNNHAFRPTDNPTSLRSLCWQFSKVYNMTLLNPRS
jgi:hypothetical protein